MTDTQDNRRGARRLWLWPVAILVSFPIGGYLADLVVDGVDSVWAALVGGLIAGLIIGAAEWFALRRWASWLGSWRRASEWPRASPPARHSSTTG